MRVAVVFHDGFRSHREFLGFFQRRRFANVLFDVHRYQCFERADIDMDIHGHLHKAGVLWKRRGARDPARSRRPGDLRASGAWAWTSRSSRCGRRGPTTTRSSAWTRSRSTSRYRGYGAAQLLAFEHYRGWFFWSYRTETTPAWSFRDCVERGWLPRALSVRREPLLALAREQVTSSSGSRFSTILRSMQRLEARSGS